ncbi:MAG: methyltransferase [Croceibacterium sp.]
MDPVRPIGDYFDSPDTLFNWLNCAVFGTATVNAVNRAGVTDTLLDGPADLGSLAARHALPADKLGRILDYLLAHGLVDRNAEGQFRANSRTLMMREAAGLLANVETSSLAASQLLPALQQGRTAFELQFGAPVFDYFSRNPERAALFGDFMGFMTRRVTRFLFAHHRFEPFATVADVGGSLGDLLLAMLQEYPGTRGILCDLPDVVELARPGIEASPLAEHIELAGGSFFDSVPAADLYTLKQILHDWDDNECVQILSCIREAINPGGRLVLIDHVLSDRPEPTESLGIDMAMLIWATGRERKLAEFEALLAKANFRFERVTHNPVGHSVIEAIPV